MLMEKAGMWWMAQELGKGLSSGKDRAPT
jgi:hypothetical protein